DGVDRGDAVGHGAVEVAPDAAPAGEGGQGVPVAGDGLVALGGLGAPLRDVVRPVRAEVAGEQPDLLFVVPQPAGEAVAGVIAVVPVPEPVVDDAVRDGLVVAFPQVTEYLRVQAGVAAGAGVRYCPVRLAQDGDDLPCPGLEAARPEAGDGAAAADD